MEERDLRHLSEKKNKKKGLGIKNIDTCRNSKHFLHQNSAYIYIYIL
jgi:hypothetical protein